MCSVSLNPLNNFANSAAGALMRIIPSATFKNKRVLNTLNWMGQHISSPQNRLILGVTALMTQPFIDLHNRHVDDETKKVSAARTIAKIIAGTTTGVLVRHYSIKAVEAFTKNPKVAVNRLQSMLFPKHIANVTIKGMKHYKKALGTIISLGVMLFTNFAIDAPATKYLTNKFVPMIKNHEANKKAKEGLNVQS